MEGLGSMVTKDRDKCGKAACMVYRRSTESPFKHHGSRCDLSGRCSLSNLRFRTYLRCLKIAAFYREEET